MLRIETVSFESIPLIRELTYKVWPQTYKGILSDDQIEYMLDFMYSESSLRSQMNDGSQFLIVYDENEAVGFASFQKLSNEVYKLHKIYVLPNQQGKGIGKYVIEYVLEEIKSKGASALHLQVNKNNKARQFYERLGFHEIEQIKLDIGKGYFMDDFVMEKIV